MINLYIIDDHPLVASGIAKLVERKEGFRVIGISNDPVEGLNKVMILRPDIVFVDLEMPKMNGLDLAETLLKKDIKVKIVLLTMHFNQAVIRKATNLKLNGFIPKQAAEEEFEECLDTLESGHDYFSTNAQELLHSKALKIEKTGLNKTQLLTNREREILSMIVNGASTKEIADKLFIAVRTVETHRKAILTKLDVNNVAGMVRIAVKEGL
ncbi:MAG: response regulator transcription factor [Ekhidna sp.]|nr:response regulator transcription factor [Ekhidna sp.]